MSIDWRQMVEDLIEGDEQIEIVQLQNIIRLMISRRRIPRTLEQSYEDFFQQNQRNSLLGILEYCSNAEYDTRLFPTMIGRISGPNLWLKGEKDKPTTQEGWKAVFLLLSSVDINHILVNIDNVSQAGRNAWRRQLFSEDPMQFHRTIMNELNIHSPLSTWSPSFIALLVISLFVSRVRGQMPESEWGGERFLEILQEEFAFTDHTTLLIFSDLRGRKKKEVNYYSKLVLFINRWFGDFISGKEDKPSVLNFLDSVAAVGFTTRNGRTKKLKLMSNIREKIISDLLKFNKINGTLLNRLVDARLQEDLSNGKRFQISSARSFYKLL